ncbi:hypothetical protein ACFQBQ_07655 [Granulicella cerasi]|uniref:Uncharacterized protein n=1 Tax=Granulicella cerasi TaxID=741063 RepID=A0ABW1Z7P0_9BACT|nr:hypothetical protein [Granulicella cerasi]
MGAVKTMWASKKVYLVAALMCLVAAYLVFVHQVSAQTAVDILIFGLGLLGLSIADALKQHQNAVLALFLSLAKAGEDYERHDAPALRQDSVVVVGEAAAVVREVKG